MLARQLTRDRRDPLPALALAADRAARALQAGNLDALTLTSVEGALLARRLERISVQQALQEQAIALQALLGTPANPPDASGSTARETTS